MVPSPDRLLVDPAAERIWDDEMATQTEDTEELEERMSRFESLRY